MLLTSRKPSDPDPTTDHEPPTTVTMGTRSPWSASWSARPQARPRASREPRTGHRARPTVPGPATVGRPCDARPTDPHSDAQTQAVRSPQGACAVLQPDLRTRRSGILGPTAQPHRATRLRRILGRLRSPIAHRPTGAAQSVRNRCAPGEGGVVGPATSPTTAARRLRCRIVTGGRGSWPSAWSGSADELTAWNTRTPAHPGPTTAPLRRARCAALATGRCPHRGHGGEPLRDRGPPGRDGG
jgi:hypothetical protein